LPFCRRRPYSPVSASINTSLLNANKLRHLRQANLRAGCGDNNSASCAVANLTTKRGDGDRRYLTTQTAPRSGSSQDGAGGHLAMTPAPLNLSARYRRNLLKRQPLTTPPHLNDTFHCLGNLHHRHSLSGQTSSRHTSFTAAKGTNMSDFLHFLFATPPMLCRDTWRQSLKQDSVAAHTHTHRDR